MKFGLLYFNETANLGDDIQTYASKQFLPRVDYLVERENLNCFIPNKKEQIAVIMNAWFMHNKAAWPPSPYIKPLLISMHFVNDEKFDVGDKYIKGEGGKFLKKYGPVGTRDYSTMEMLTNNGINAYFSGCMTLTINKFQNVEKEDYICVVDTSDEVLKKIKKNTNKEVRVMTHWRIPEEMKNKTIDDRMLDVENQLKQYQAASLIITERLHVALPALALETPVILIRNNNIDPTEVNRYKSLENLTNCYKIDEFLNSDICRILNEENSNPQEYIIIREKLKKSCSEFVKNCDNELDEEELPEIEEFNKYIDNIKWHNELYLELKKKLKEIANR